jgi:hypothetical protein
MFKPTSMAQYDYATIDEPGPIPYDDTGAGITVPASRDSTLWGRG